MVLPAKVPQVIAILHGFDPFKRVCTQPENRCISLAFLPQFVG